MFLLTLAIGNSLVSPARSVTRSMLGHDFLAFYTAGHFARIGQLQKLYDLDAARDFQRDIAARNGLEIGQSFGPFWNPPFYAWVFAPLSALPYRAALLAWWAINLACLAMALWLLRRMLPADADWRTWGLVPLLILTSLPFQQALSHAQNTCISLLILTVAVNCWRNGKPLAAGLAATLLSYKPQLGLVFVIVLVLSMGRRALLGALFTGTALLLTIWTMPGAIGDYVMRLPRNLRQMQELGPYIWERHATLLAFWRLAIQGHAIGATSSATMVLGGLCWLGLASLLASALYRHMHLRKRLGKFGGNPITMPSGGTNCDRLISATIVSMPLLMPFYFDYDLLMLAAPATLLGSELAAGSGFCRADRWLVRIWIAFGLWTLIGPGAARWLHVNITVILLLALAVLHIARACRRSAGPRPAAMRPTKELAAAA